MELILLRSYFPNGCNGVLLFAGKRICHTIELPWRDNQKLRSCIPEGRYALKKRYSPKFKWHLQVADVPGRSLILIHPANDALRELNGCIAPVCTLTAAGKGQLSKNALERIKAIVYQRIKQGPVYLTITSNPPKEEQTTTPNPLLAAAEQAGTEGIVNLKPLLYGC